MNLIELNKRGAADVFSKGKRLHACLKGVREPSNLARHSAGDGAWIVQKCATTLRGGCSIDFRETSTVFSIWCPVSVYEAPSKAAGNDCPRPKFRFPKNTWAIALDDSKVRRKLLKRFLNLGGFADDRMIIQGESYEEISSFDDFALKFITNHPDAYFLLIVDENLDVSMDNGVTKQGTISGSRLVQSLRNHLLPEQECQVLALIRSANDSKHDIAMYKSRAHGFIPKAPLDRERIQENLDQLWKERFDSLESDEETERGSVVSCVSTQPSAVDTETSLDDQGLNLFENFRGVDELLKDGHRDLETKWPEIWEKLHAFKGDLVCLNDTNEAATIACTISNMRGSLLPANFLSRYEDIRTLVKSLNGKKQADTVPREDEEASDGTM